jgi:hypothetical protein
MILQKYIEKAKKNNKILVIVGVTMKIPKTTHKFYIKINAETLFKQLYLRTIDSICSNHDNIKKLFNKNYSSLKTDQILSSTYKIRGNLPSAFRNIKEEESEYKKLGYKIVSSDEIYKKILTILNNI